MQTDTAPTDYAPGQKPGPRFTRALRRAATRDPACVRDERGTVWRATTHEAHRADVARYATRQQVARTKALQARAAAEDAVSVAQDALCDAELELKEAEEKRDAGALYSGRLHVKLRTSEVRRAEKTLRDARAFAAAVESDEGLPPLPEVPPAGKPVEPPYVGGNALATNRQASQPAGTRAEHRRTYSGGMPADVAERLDVWARRCAAREQAQRDRRMPRTRRGRALVRVQAERLVDALLACGTPLVDTALAIGAATLDPLTLRLHMRAV